MMSLALNVSNWWECSGKDLRVMNLRGLNFVTRLSLLQWEPSFSLCLVNFCYSRKLPSLSKVLSGGG